LKSLLLSSGWYLAPVVSLIVKSVRAGKSTGSPPWFLTRTKTAKYS